VSVQGHQDGVECSGKILKKGGIPYRTQKGKMKLGVEGLATELLARNPFPVQKIIIPNP
jgi:hypothetical protein